MMLSILIPTYCRSEYLNRNLKIIIKYILKGNFIKEIEIIVSNNNSKDDTTIIVSKLKEEHGNIELNYYEQKENIGAVKNVLFILDKAQGEYIMFLGDDDYIEFKYLDNAMRKLSEKSNISAIIPNFVPVNIDGEIIGKGRDTHLQNSFHKAGFKNCLKNSWRGHQLSGLILKRDNLLKSYVLNKVNNIYLTIYFVSITCLTGDCFHLTDYPVKVTQPGQENKDWTYGEDGLLNEVYDNYKKLRISSLKKTILQLYFLQNQFWRLTMYKKIGIGEYKKAYKKIWLTKNSTFLFKLIFPLFVLQKNILRKLIKK